MDNNKNKGGWTFFFLGEREAFADYQTTLDVDSLRVEPNGDETMLQGTKGKDDKGSYTVTKDVGLN